jgi:hypothetical protein
MEFPLSGWKRSATSNTAGNRFKILLSRGVDRAMARTMLLALSFATALSRSACGPDNSTATGRRRCHRDRQKHPGAGEDHGDKIKGRR